MKGSENDRGKKKKQRGEKTGGREQTERRSDIEEKVRGQQRGERKK
jgi:hypothetical protein